MVCSPFNLKHKLQLCYFGNPERYNDVPHRDRDLFPNLGFNFQQGLSMHRDFSDCFDNPLAHEGQAVVSYNMNKDF